jgi:hypothetical protein
MTDKEMPRDESKVQEAEQLVLDRAVAFVESLKMYDSYPKDMAEKYMKKIVKEWEDELRVAVATLLAAEAAA